MDYISIGCAGSQFSACLHSDLGRPPLAVREYFCLHAPFMSLISLLRLPTKLLRNYKGAFLMLIYLHKELAWVMLWIHLSHQTTETQHLFTGALERILVTEQWKILQPIISCSGHPILLLKSNFIDYMSNINLSNLFWQQMWNSCLAS